jgi:hypothetical protein
LVTITVSSPGGGVVEGGGSLEQEISINVTIEERKRHLIIKTGLNVRILKSCRRKVNAAHANPVILSK